ncbi:UNVERIFIED_CONTAM: Rho guanine nucleotide exchange factor 8 [Sesamum radiatum]|uniref:Rho guanine nucleotide exchange factor 8 n=1 Tax=Sesamum radiatum TaxID=300843 RepID=A0AAW2R2N4_SESRA
MVKEERGVQKARSFHFRKMFDRQSHNVVHEHANIRIDERIQFMNESAAVATAFIVAQQICLSPLPKDGAKKDKQATDMELMKEKFSKLLLGEDMSGGGKGVSSALALSNAITNLAASVFGEQRKLEPMCAERKARWKKEIDWLLSVTDYIVELVPSQQRTKDGTDMEDILDNFTDEQEFRYVSRDADESEQGTQSNEKWWLPTVKVSPDGLSEESRQFLQKQKESVNQVLKASMAINSQILADMEIPDNYIESLPKFLSTMDLSSELKVLDLKNRIEASIVIWKRKMHHKDGKSSWGSSVSLEKRELFEERAETILLLLKQKFPGIPQSSLEISKIQYNKDVGLSILESYSRVLETLANTVMSRIQDVLYADSQAQNPSLTATPKQSGNSMPSPTLSCYSSQVAEAEKLCSAAETPTSMSLSDFMGWKVGLSETEIKKNHSNSNIESYAKSEEDNMMAKPPNITTKKFSYIDKIEMTILRSPTARH